MTARDWAALPHFAAGEFQAPDKMGYEFMRWLAEVRARAGVSMVISSSSRSPERNRLVGGAADSAHVDVPCNAVDIAKRPTAVDPNWNAARFAIIRAALSLGCSRIGVYPNGSLHIDRSEATRPGSRIWIAVDNPAR